MAPARPPAAFAHRHACGAGPDDRVQRGCGLGPAGGLGDPRSGCIRRGHGFRLPATAAARARPLRRNDAAAARCPSRRPHRARRTALAFGGGLSARAFRAFEAPPRRRAGRLPEPHRSRLVADLRSGAPARGAAGVLVGMLFLAGARAWQLFAILFAAGAALPLLPYLLHGYQRRRLEIFLDPTQDPLGAGYNLLQARIAVGSGGLFGRGWLHGLQGQLGFVPERATDFVFATFAEEFGLLGSLVLLTLFGTLLIRALRSATLSPDRFGELLASGTFVMVFVQVVENVGMNIGLLPIAGIPLPLISYGGSATVTTLAALGLVQSVMVRRRLVAHEETS